MSIGEPALRRDGALAYSCLCHYPACPGNLIVSGTDKPPSQTSKKPRPAQRPGEANPVSKNGNAGDFSAALENFQRALNVIDESKVVFSTAELTGDMGNIRIHQAETYLMMGRIPDARQDYEAAGALLKAEYKRSGVRNLLLPIQWGEKNSAPELKKQDRSAD